MIAIRGRATALIGAAVAVLALGAALSRETPIAEPGAQAQPTSPERTKPDPASRLAERFAHGVAMLRGGDPDRAAGAFHDVLLLAPRMPEAHVNMGFSLVARERWAAAADFFETAIALRAAQANAYYGLALAREALGDRERALGAMRTYVHLAPSGAPHVRRARAALWEWQAVRAGPDASSHDAHPGPTHDR